MLIHLSKFEFHSKGKQIVVVQNIENKNPTPTQEKYSLLSLLLCLLRFLYLLPTIPNICVLESIVFHQPLYPILVFFPIRLFCIPLFQTSPCCQQRIVRQLTQIYFLVGFSWCFTRGFSGVSCSSQQHVPHPLLRWSQHLHFPLHRSFDGRCTFISHFSNDMISATDSIV